MKKHVFFSLLMLLLMCDLCLQAERIMEALELYREENRKMEEYKLACQTVGNEVET